MAVVTFRKPEEGLDYYKHVIELVTMFQDIVRNPDISKTINSLAKQVHSSLELSEEKQKELIDAQEVLAQSKEFVDEFDKVKASHEAKVRKDLEYLEQKQNQLTGDIDANHKAKIAAQEAAIKAKTEVEKTLVVATTRLSEAKALENSLQELAKTLDADKKLHDKNVAAFETHKKELATEMQQKHEQHEQQVKVLHEDRAALEARKRKLDTLLKEAD